MFMLTAEVTLRLERSVAHHEVSSCSHQRLRDASPLSAALDSRRRYGQQHAVGNLVHAFIAMHRISVSYCSINKLIIIFIF